MKLKLKNIKILLIWMGTGIFVFASIGLAHREKDSMVCGNVLVSITNQHDNYFIDEKDLMSIISMEGNLSLVGNYLENLDLRALESSLEQENFIKEAQVYKDLKGNIIVKAEQRRPVARIVRKGNPDVYIDDEGILLPISEKFTSRVMLITGEYVNRFAEVGIAGEYQNYMDLITRVNSDPFWKAQISQIDIGASGEIFIYTQVSKQVIEFGLPEDLDSKFRKLEVFYKKILPFRGWNTYERVNLKYLNQIVCE